MPQGNVHSHALTPEARKHLLLVACTIDRLDLAANLRKPPMSARVLSQITELPWFGVAASILPRILPKKLLFLVTLWRLFRKHRSTS